MAFSCSYLKRGLHIFGGDYEKFFWYLLRSSWVNIFSFKARPMNLVSNSEDFRHTRVDYENCPSKKPQLTIIPPHLTHKGIEQQKKRQFTYHILSLEHIPQSNHVVILSNNLDGLNSCNRPILNPNLMKYRVFPFHSLQQLLHSNSRRHWSLDNG